ncbi:MAG: hypothetical protein LBF16_15020, partial [Pseudomonadales bacterium]|nr:hypothetical protein [Pseudomonadales bacterium]
IALPRNLRSGASRQRALHGTLPQAGEGRNNVSDLIKNALSGFGGDQGERLFALIYQRLLP